MRLTRPRVRYSGRRSAPGFAVVVLYGRANLTVIPVFPMIHMEHPDAWSKPCITVTPVWRGAGAAICQTG